jgi:hypothetical protein
VLKVAEVTAVATTPLPDLMRRGNTDHYILVWYRQNGSGYV